MTEAVEQAESIWVVGFDEEDLEEETKDRFLWRRDKIARERIPPERLKGQFTQFVESMRQVIASIPTDAGDLRLDEVRLTAEIGAKGSVNLLGNGGEVSGSGGIVVTFRRSDS